MATHETLTIDRREKTVVITLNRPDEANGINGLWGIHLTGVVLRLG